ncbi:MAG TPA: hypothetical protein PLG34_12260 [Spirochaetota bacterium]|nr:hypothetical protein [Spirochaetota bacterium]HPY88743.1 hypothetical protein [Spirochaetota bacterium]HQB60048.1 hypothetical protein [Spirochaetota bacterium]
MGKKVFVDDDQNVKTAIDKFKMEQKTRDSIIKIETTPTIYNLQVVKDDIDSDKQLTKSEKSYILDFLENKYFSVFFQECPTDYENLKKEALFFKDLTEKSFYLMAQRLKIIRDNQLYKIDNYDDFKSFIDNEIKINQSTVYRYIDIIEKFGLATLQVDMIEYTKLLPALPLLKLNIPEDTKEEIKKIFLEESKVNSARDMQKKAVEIKKQLSIDNPIIIKNQQSFWNKIYQNILKEISLPITEPDKKIVEDIIDTLKKYISN